MKSLIFAFVVLVLFPEFGHTAEQDADEVLKLLPDVLNINEKNLILPAEACLDTSDYKKDCEDYLKKLPLTESRKLKNAMECFSSSNPFECGQMSSWLRRKLPDYKHIDHNETKKAIIAKIELIEKHEKNIFGCYANLDQTKKNLCFIKNNLSQMEVVKHGTRVTPDGLFNDYTRYDEWLVINTSDKNLVLTTPVSRLNKGVDSLLITKKGRKPFEGGKNNTVGIMSFAKGEVRLQNAELSSGEFEYYGRKIKTNEFGYGADTVIPISAIHEEKETCGINANPSLLIEKAIAKIEGGWDPYEADKIKAYVESKAALEGLQIGAHNLYDSGAKAVDSIKMLFKLIGNAEVPDPEGAQQCVEAENKKQAVEFNNKCSGMHSVFAKAIGMGYDKVFGTCFKQHCTGIDQNKKNWHQSCLIEKAKNPVTNPIFQGKMAGCVGHMLKETLGPAIADYVKKCLGEKGGYEVSRCLSDIAVVAGTAALTGGTAQAIKAVGAVSSTALATAVNAGRITAESAKWLGRIGNVSKGASLVAVDLVLNPLPTDPTDLIKVRKGLFTILKEKNVPKDVAKLANDRLKEIDSLIADKGAVENFYPNLKNIKIKEVTPDVMKSMVKDSSYSRILLKVPVEKQVSIARALKTLEEGGSTSAQAAATYNKFENIFLKVQSMSKPDSKTPAILSTLINKQRKAGFDDSAIKKKLEDAFNCK